MRTKNIEVKFRIPVPINEPDGNGVPYDTNAIKEACKDANERPMEIVKDNGEHVCIGIASKVYFIDEDNCIEVDGVIWNGGTCEQADIVDKIVKGMTITSFGLCGKE